MSAFLFLAAFRWELILKVLAASNLCNKSSLELNSSLLQKAEVSQVACGMAAGVWRSRTQHQELRSVFQDQVIDQDLDMIRNASQQSRHALVKTQPRTNLIITALRTLNVDLEFQTSLGDITKSGPKQMHLFNFSEDFFFNLRPVRNDG